MKAINLLRTCGRRSVALFLAGIALGVGCLVSTSAVAAPEVKIGIFYEARAADQPWSASIYDAAQSLKKENPSIKLLESFNAFDPTAAAPIARQMIQQGAAIVDFHSFALNDVARTMGKEFPKVAMAVSSFDPPAQPNVNVVTASYLQIGYANCWLLAKLSKTGKIGYVGPMPIPYATELLEGCEAGAKAARPEVQVLSAYSNSFDNQQATREQAQALLDRGADALFPASATQDSLGGFQLCEQKRVPCAGWASSIRRYAPKYGVVSSMINWSGAFKDLVKKVHSPEMTAETYDATFGNGLLTPQPFTAADSAIVPADVQKGYLAVIQTLAKREAGLPKSKAHPCCE